jgi:outer membrane protein assembly factor BamA
MRNFLGDGRIMNLRVQGKTQSLLEIFKGASLDDTLVIGYTDLEFRLLQPYFFSRRVSAFWIATVGLEKQKFYSLSIARNRIGTNYKLTQQLLNVAEWTLERVRPEILVDSVDSDETLASLDAEDQPQFNSILTLTFQLNRANEILSPAAGDIHTLTLEESGVLPNLLPNLTGGLPYTQYYKAALLSRWYNDLTERRFNILATKFRIGYQTKYGQSKESDVRIPLNRRFFAGGSTSVRGWGARDLGAMPPEQLEFGGDFLIEGSAEFRVNHFSAGGTFLGADLKNLWAAYFVDAGNVWQSVNDFHPDQIALAAGLGIRYETLFGPFRLDFGMRMYDPQAEPGRRFITQRKFFPETVADGVFHFGIGHAF